MKLHTIKNDTGKRSWCGPAAIGSVTGKSTALYKACTRGGGMSNAAMERYLRAEFGAGVRRIATYPRMRLWAALPFGMRGVVAVRGHFLAFSDKLVQDSNVPYVHWVFDSKYRNRKVEALWIVKAL